MTDHDVSNSLGQLDAEITRLRAKAEKAREKVAATVVTRKSSDNTVTVTVGAGGNLLGLEFGNRAYTRPPHQLAHLVMRLVDQARQQAGDEIRTAFGGLVGENSTALELLTRFLPNDVEDLARNSDDLPGRGRTIPPLR